MVMARIVMFGATGLVGGLLLPQLKSHIVVHVGRRVTDGGRAVPVEDWPAVVAELAPEVLISTLGTTIRAAGSRRAFETIDYDAVLAIATAAKATGARQMLMVSSVGADARASNFYLRTKGRAEADVAALGFERLDIFRPGLLTGARGGSFRFVEQALVALSPVSNALTPRRFDRYRAIAAADVAVAMAKVVGAPQPGVHIHHNREMLEPRGELA
jgi:uncharacterized protein YbjT (DUF2867 family)